MENTELFIIEGLKQGKEEAYRYLYEHHYVALCHVAKEYVGDEALAEHLAGDVIFHLWEVRETLDIRISLFRNWKVTIRWANAISWLTIIRWALYWRKNSTMRFVGLLAVCRKNAAVFS